ncbi:MAG TPA: histidine kinase [Saprospiraceae bacterium]|nr:histidine kinase [Saprospiraceae bacterium]HPN70060.1 histidine kinase [Saprospiraceae bacterium]
MTLALKLNTSFKTLLQHFTHNVILQHSTFWIVMSIILAILNQSSVGFLPELWYELVNVSFFALVVYFNKYYLFPLYLKDNNFGLHLLYLLITAIVFTPIKSFCLFYATSLNIMRDYSLGNQKMVFLSTFLVGAGSSIYYIMNDWIRSQKVKQELKSENLQSELKFLKSQINPHFLFNTLNSLYALTLKKSDLAPEIVLRLSEMMRYMLYECNEKQVPLEKEVNYMINYLELEKLRHGNKFHVEVHVGGEIKNQKIAPLMFIPFIENCFKHGLNHQISEGFVKINLTGHPENVDIIIENSKAPILPSRGEKKSGGIGLVNVKRRLELLYPNQYSLDIMDHPNSYTVNLKINLN